MVPASAPLRRRVGTVTAVALALEEGIDGIDRRSWSVIAMVSALAIGVGLALVIGAVMRGVERDVARTLPRQGLSPSVDIEAIEAILRQGRFLLTGLAILLSTTFVAIVAWVAAGRRRREVGVLRQFGVPSWEILAEAIAEATILCILGCVLGIFLGLLTCRVVPSLPALSALSARIDVGDVVVLVLSASSLNLLVITAIFACFAAHPSGVPDL